MAGDVFSGALLGPGSWLRSRALVLRNCHCQSSRRVDIVRRLVRTESRQKDERIRQDR